MSFDPDLKRTYDEIKLANDELERQSAQLRKWVCDLQSGMWVNCIYCGHRYGPNATTSSSKADVLKAHVETCKDHPMSELRREVTFLTRDRDNHRMKTCELEEALETARMAVLVDGSKALKDLLIERGLGKMTLVDVMTFLAAIRQVAGLEKP